MTPAAQAPVRVGSQASLRVAVAALAGLLAFTAVTGCVSHQREPYRAQPPGDQLQVQPPAPPAPFAGQREPPVVTIEPTGKRRAGHYSVNRFSFDAVGQNGQRANQVYGRLFTGDQPGPRPAVIILPVWGISEYPSRKLARDLLRRADGRIDVMLIESDGYLIDWDALAEAQTPEQFERLAHETGDRVSDSVRDVRRALAWLKTLPQIDRERVAVAGFSLSAVVASLALQHEPGFAAGVLIMGGSNPAEIFAVCDGRPGDVREAVMPRFGWTREHYRQVFERGLAGGDARDYTGRIADPSRLLVIEATRDDCMTRTSRDGLWQALGKPERIGFHFRHRPAFYAMTPLGFNVLGRYAVRFLERKLLAETQAGGS